MQWLVDTSPRSRPWTVERMIGEIVAVWFSSVHQLAMVDVVSTSASSTVWLRLRKSTVFAIEDLCTFSEFVDPLREEAGRQPVSADGMPLLDSFLKESARFSSIDAGKLLFQTVEIGAEI